MKNLVYALVGAGFMIACQPSRPTGNQRYADWYRE